MLASFKKRGEGLAIAERLDFTRLAIQTPQLLKSNSCNENAAI
jgi:hypothetical protein